MPPPVLSTTDSGRTLQIAARTYALSLCLALTPNVVPLIASPKARSGGIKTVINVLKRELRWNAFAMAMTIAVGGGSALQHLWAKLDQHYRISTWSSDEKTRQPGSRSLKNAVHYLVTLPESSKTFTANMLSAALAIVLLQSQRRRPNHRITTSMTVPLHDPNNGGRASGTLDLTLLLFVRAMDSIMRARVLPSVSVEVAEGIQSKEANIHRRRLWTTRLDAFVFWASSARIMWCFFYQPDRLPRTYNKWIMSMANIDPRILEALRAIRSGSMSYAKGQSDPLNFVSSLSESLGHPAAWGDFSRIPARGSPDTVDAWTALGVSNRDGLGGIPCELVHGDVMRASCTANAVIRGSYAFLEALVIYLPVHALPILLTNPRKLLRVGEVTKTLLAVFRSSAFLSTFVSSMWMSVCLTRTLLLARLIPSVSHDFWDGPLGCTCVGSLVCGASIWIEQGRRRGEMSLYVLPRALRACLSDSWTRSGSRSVQLTERLVFILSLATLLTASAHRADSLRGLSRWTLAFIMKGPTIGTWRRKSEVLKQSFVDSAPTSANTYAHLRQPPSRSETT